MAPALPAECQEIFLAPGYPALQIKTDHCQATLALHGAHLIHWQPAHCQQPVLYTSPQAVFQEGKAIRGGIPLCWPWFNAHPTAPDRHPSHGVARTRFWQLESVAIEAAEARLSLILPPDDETRRHVPFPFFLRATFHLGKTCSVLLETQNRGTRNALVGGALHSYLALSSLAHCKLLGLENTPAIDTTPTPERILPGEESPLTIRGEVDRIYTGTALPVTLRDPGWQREIALSKEGSLSTVIWNPAEEKAAALADLPDQGYQDFVCIEAANARQDTRIIAPGAWHRLGTTLRVTNPEG
ncbi:D-hexose-6-phosphate mutarotase [Roseibacillus ishigakijimensis]|uniref:Putative glucose-6-phosphate 1-epimerase n=1 Tax=Roseibacillus ishigakijimensis TaxID=454146 RepID=A0A934RNW0_9BACT|nr:D-hexose-6-phosphate mutarotase [Roseibacillus ishigakijimensis]MBK1834824.1 D-hexose-6-phosphate mutarotase [Roseibacillus ishigakijimensis]